MGHKNSRWVVGVQACKEVLKVRPKSVQEVCFLQIEEASKDPWQPLLKAIKPKPQRRKVSFFTQLSPFGHQGVALHVNDQPEWLESPEGLLVYLDQVSDPQNVGAILRTSWLMGAQGLAVTERNSAKLSPAVAKVASGGAEHVPVQEQHFASELGSLKENGYWVYGFSEKGEKSLEQIDFSPKTVLIFGSEDKGLRSSTLGVCDELVSIPQSVPEASYNVSVSAAIACWQYKMCQLKSSVEK